MVELDWLQLAGDEVEYRGSRWEMTGSVEIRNTGEIIAVEANRIDDPRQPTGNLLFGLEERAPSINPGNLEQYFVELERERGAYYLHVKAEPRTYRYHLQSIERT